MQTKVIETKFKEIYFSPDVETNKIQEEKDSQLMFMMNLMAFQNLTLIQCRH